mgnify:CR=1 FL=1
MAASHWIPHQVRDDGVGMLIKVQLADKLQSLRRTAPTMDFIAILRRNTSRAPHPIQQQHLSL